MAKTTAGLAPFDFKLNCMVTADEHDTKVDDGRSSWGESARVWVGGGVWGCGWRLHVLFGNKFGNIV